MIKKYHVAVAACAAEIPASAPGEIRLLPAGTFRAKDGRPEDAPAWVLDGEAAAGIIAQAAAAAGDFVIDYEHQTLNAEENGQPAPAAGWFKQLEWREGDGLYAVDVRWTAKARALIEAGEYRYISPVFKYAKGTGTVLALLMAAITNYPAIDGNSDLAARAAAKFQPTTEEEHVDREKLIEMLGLAKDASDTQIEQALAALKTKAATADAKDQEIASLKKEKDAEIAALKASGGKPDPEKYVPAAMFEELKTEVASLRSQQTDGTVAALVEQGLKDGKLLPAQKEWATDLGKKDVAALKSYLEKTPAIAALKGGTQTNGKEPENDGGEELTAEELAVCKNLGVSAEEYKKANAEA